jgi:hypothetical protein
MSDNDKVMIWYWKTNHWVMGGRVHKPVNEFVDIIEERVMGKGIICFSFLTEKGEFKIADQASRGIVGDSWEEVQKDIDDGDKEVMDKQVADAIAVMEKEGWL